LKVNVGKSKVFSKGEEEFEDTKGVIIIHKSKTTDNTMTKANKDKQRYTKLDIETNDRATRTPLKIGSELRCSSRVNSSCSTSDTRRVILVTKPVISHQIF